MTSQEIAALAQLQRRASAEDRAHLVALVEHAWGVPAASAERLIPLSMLDEDDDDLDEEDDSDEE